jgi:glycerol-3-phosphate dehydrogenase (NAD(P)+)
MKFTVIGAGAWGTAFALHLARAGQSVALVPRRVEQADAMRNSRQNADYLPGIHLPPEVVVERDLREALNGVDVVLLACPSQALRPTVQKLAEALGGARPQLIISLAKGLETTSYFRPSQVINAVLPGIPAGNLTGPTNANEIARGLPAAMVLGVPEALPHRAALEIQAALSSASLRVYTSEDLPGVEYGGSLKNIYAIAAGCCDGLKLGDNTRAALLTRALAEMVRVGVALGAKAETFYGLSGFGDLVATCHGAWSRNREFGFEIGAGRTVAELMANRKTVVEGYRTTQSFHGLCTERRIDAPILAEMHAILFEGRQPAHAIHALMTRTLKRETSEPIKSAAM